MTRCYSTGKKIFVSSSLMSRYSPRRRSNLIGCLQARIIQPSFGILQQWRNVSLSTSSQKMLEAAAAGSSHHDRHAHLWQHWLAAAAITVGAAATMLNTVPRNTTGCSGIAAVVGSKGNSREFLSQGLGVFTNRGFDGVGLATLNHENGKLKISKSSHASPNTTTTTAEAPSDAVSRLVQSHYMSLQQSGVYAPTVGCAHTRWATKGNRCQSNAHPHTDSTGKIALVHNGTLTNANDLRLELERKGYIFESQTDSEVIAKLIGHYYYDDNSDLPAVTVRDATARALQRCDGTWGLCILCEDTPDELVVACNGSLLYIGVGGDEKIYVSSELEVFQPYTKNYIDMKDGEIGVLQAYGQRSLDLSRVEETPRSSHGQGGTEEMPRVPEPHPHWTLKEIMEQPEAIARALGYGGRLGWEGVHLGGLDGKTSVLQQIKHLVVAGCGSSLNAARYGERIMKHLDSVSGSITSLDVVEAVDDDLPCIHGSIETVGNTTKEFGNTGLIAVSQSGETKSVYELVSNAMEKGVSVMSVVNTVGSLVARTTKLGVYCHAGQENGVVSTKTFATQVTILSLVALWFRELRDKVEGTNSSFEAERLKDALLRLPISFGMALKTRDRCKEVAKRLKDKHHCFVLGKGKSLSQQN